MDWRKTLVVAPMSAVLLFGGSSGLASVSAESAETPTVDTAAVDLRADLGHLLSEHAYLAIETMRNGAAGSDDFDAAADALSANTDDLSDAIASVYGDDAGKDFKDIWSAHIGYFVSYVEATEADDEDGRQEALDNLSQYKKDFSEFLESATDERLEADSLADGLQEHIGQLIGAFDSYEDGDYQAAYEHEREAINHMHMIAKGLSTAMTDQFPDKFDNTEAATPAADLREDLGYLLSEHAGLAISAMQNGIMDAPDFDASADVLNQNTEDLSEAIASVYGDEAGDAFKDMWAEHVGYFVDYTEAAAADDDDAKQEALDNLNDYRADFSAFMDDATDGEVPADDLSDGLQMHVEQLISSFDSYEDGDYDAAYDKAREAYGHMYGAAELLSSGIVAQHPDKFASDMPSDMPKTGFAPAEENNHMMLWIMGAAVLALAAIITIRKYKASEGK